MRARPATCPPPAPPLTCPGSPTARRSGSSPTYQMERCHDRGSIAIRCPCQENRTCVQRHPLHHTERTVPVVRQVRLADAERKVRTKRIRAGGVGQGIVPGRSAKIPCRQHWRAFCQITRVWRGGLVHWMTPCGQVPPVVYDMPKAYAKKVSQMQQSARQC